MGVNPRIDRTMVSSQTAKLRLDREETVPYKKCISILFGDAGLPLVAGGGQTKRPTQRSIQCIHLLGRDHGTRRRREEGGW